VNPRRTSGDAGRPESSHRLSKEGRRVAAARHADAKSRILDAIQKIEAIIIRNDGIYPDMPDGKVSVQAVLKVAGLSPAYLEKDRPNIRALKAEVRGRLKKIAEVTLGNVDVIRKKIGEQANAARAETRKVRQAYAEAELGHAQTVFELAEARKRIEILEKENADLLKQIAGRKVVPIDRGRRK
jgi:hypothetical protein